MPDKKNDHLIGFINVYKPKEITSFGVIKKLKGFFPKKTKIGHLGTLDPAVTGVLPLAVGKATKLIPFLKGEKRYRAEIIFGIKTDTYDLTGEIKEKNDASSLTEEQIKKNFQRKFIGEFSQTVPLFSASHYKGKKLYHYAQEGKKIENLPNKKVKVQEVKYLDFVKGKNPTWEVELKVSKGTYIRSIANELGDEIGFGGCLKNLERLSAGDFKKETSIPLEKLLKSLEKNGKITDYLLSPLQFMSEYKAIEVKNEALLKRISHGNFIYLKGGEEWEDFLNQNILLTCEEELLAIARLKKDHRGVVTLHPHKVL